MTKWGAMRASDEDREQIITRLRAAATEGRIAAEELEQRVTAALRARTYAELDATVADLPSSNHSRRPGRPARRVTTAGIALSVLRTHPLLLLVVAPMVLAAAAMVLAATVVWAVLMVVVMVLGGRPRGRRPPLMYTRYRRAYYGPPHRRPRSYWA